MNVILISLDTVRADFLGYAGSWLAETPNIDALAGKGVVFTRAISTNSITTPAHCSMLTGLYPMAHGVHGNGTYALPASEETLAEFLKSRGYVTAGFVSAFPVSRRFGLAQGFDLYDDRISLPEQEKGDGFRMGIFAQRSAGEVADAVISWVRKELPSRKPFFLFIHFFDAHAPYAPPEEFIRRFGTAREQRYAGEIAYIDKQLGRILSSCDRANALDDTLIIVTSDHGESLGEHGEETHGLFIYDSTIHVPLIFQGGPCVRRILIEDQVGIVDIFPTVADLLGFSVPPKVQGRSLKGLLLGTAERLDERPYYIESYHPYETFGWSPLIGFRKSFEKFILAPYPELYDLAKDPLEEKNLYESQGEHAKETELELSDLLRSIQGVPGRAETRLSVRERELLQSLGYIGAGIRVTPSGALADPKDRIDLFRKMEAARLQIYSGKNVGSALEELRNLEQKDPGNAVLRLTIGQTLVAMNRHEEAEAYYTSLLSKFPDFPEILNELAGLLLKRKEWEKAARQYKRSLEINHLQVELYPNLAYALIQMGNGTEATKIIDRALQMIPDDGSLHTIRAEIAFQAQDFATAAEHYSFVHRNKPKDPDVAQSYARSLLMAGQAAQAASILEPFESMAGEDTDLLLLYGQCLAQAGHVKEAMNCFGKVLAREDRSSAHYFMGLCFLKLGQVEEAKKHFSMLSKDDPNFEQSQQALKSIRPR
ncbi:MAG: sulfatase-like hydrolase/transferase [Acidobacteriota bacterium]